MWESLLDTEEIRGANEFTIANAIDGGKQKKEKKEKKPKQVKEKKPKAPPKRVSKIDGAFAEYQAILGEFNQLSKYIGGQMGYPHVNFSDVNDGDLYGREEKKQGMGEDKTAESSEEPSSEKINNGEFSIMDAI